MKQLLMACVLLLSAAGLAQPTNGQSAGSPVAVAASPENTYALVVGIANYENDRLNLNYSNRDAEVFAEYLRSAAGGSVPQDNIRLLLDADASTGAIYNALKWLKKKTELARIQDENARNLVYIYFSGHGDVETGTRANLGFLLAYNTPPNNYLNNAVRIEDLNDYAHTLSVDLGATVILITDACHSGKLAGSDYRGSYLVGKALSAAKDREVRIASCNPEELSMEDQRWGGGRGVFSWYLVNGLKGLADRNGDYQVTLAEIQHYVDSSLAADAVLKELKHKQTPVLNGNARYGLALVDTGIRLMTAMAVAPANVAPSGFPWEAVNGVIDEQDSNFFTPLKIIPDDSLVYGMIQQVRKALQNNNDLLSRTDNTLQQVRAGSLSRREFADKMVELLHTRGQKIVNQYLEGDEAELERRQYYNSRKNGYGMVADLYTIATRLAEPGDPLHRILLLHQLYFNGVAARMQMNVAKPAEQNALLEKALQLQQKAVAMDDNAAYVQNELGILYLKKGDMVKAEAYFTKATELSPSWAIPRSNLTGLYMQKGDMVRAEEEAKEAERLQPGGFISQAAVGALEERKGNLLFAEENYRQAMFLNSRHYYPFERMGFVSLGYADYAAADSFFHEAALRKKGYYFRGSESLFASVPVLPVANSTSLCPLDTSKLRPDDVIGHYYWASMLYEIKDYVNAERIFRKVVKLDPRNPLVFHYLGKVFYDQKRWEPAELMFKQAMQNWLPREQFDRYCDSLKRSNNYSNDQLCYLGHFRTRHYGQSEDYFFLARMYELWGHFEEAETWCRAIINRHPKDPDGYLMLWEMQEKREQMTEAEKTILQFAKHQPETGYLELTGFYKRAHERYPENSEWPYRLSLLLFEKAMLPGRYNNFDTIIWFPREGKEIFIGHDNYMDLGGKFQFDRNDPNNPSALMLEGIHPYNGFIILPGINEGRTLQADIADPRWQAITWLKVADSLQREPGVKADISFKLGQVYHRAGSAGQALPHFEKAIELEPANAAARMQVVDMARMVYRNRKGYAQLTYLFDSAQINFPHRLLYAEWSLRAGNPEKARKVMQEAQVMYPFYLPEAQPLNARSWMAAKQYTKAIPLFREVANRQQQDAGAWYSLARCYALAGNGSEALKVLETAIGKGFNYGFVLDADVAWAAYRKQSQWSVLLKKVKRREYPDVFKREERPRAAAQGE